ncbi:glycosyltransferase [Spirosoma sp. KUDC1026]|uniref:glycosyltransferase n=1 Tax=Spirosoma sp. KUDC1026 TaxID=2745947 RepID=UPI00159BB645|nr:glycosyltransferase [Spirosoma sp. KUDC1026]QKZ11382.1 glycosyltransferase [Spirosoma sp. KUDC1026]
MNAPIVLFGFKRARELSLTLDALKANYLAPETNLYVFVDAAKKPEDEPKVKEVHKLLDELTGFKSIYRDYAKSNIGCADSIIRGISYVLDRHSSAIMVEDDLITSPNFLDYMNQCLDYYKDKPKAYSIAGYTFPFKKPESYAYDAYFIPRHSPWGWATWADRWKSIDWSVADFDEFIKDKSRQAAFMEGGADLVRMLRRQIEGEIDAWDIRYGYSQFKAGGITVYPTVSKVQNIGFGQDATHTDIFNRYKTALDDGQKRTFDLPDVVQNTEYYKRKNIQQYSFATRFYNRLKTYAGMR